MFSHKWFCPPHQIHIVSNVESSPSLLHSNKILNTSRQITWDIHQCMQSETGFGFLGALDNLSKVNECKIVERPCRNPVVEIDHFIPGTITNSNHYNRKRTIGCLDDGFHSRFFLQYLSICCSYHQDVIREECITVCFLVLSVLTIKGNTFQDHVGHHTQNFMDHIREFILYHLKEL